MQSSFAMLKKNFFNEKNSIAKERFKQLYVTCMKLLGFKIGTKMRASGQDGGIGRHSAPPRTTKRRTTTI